MNVEELTRTIAEALKTRVLALYGVPVERVVLQAPPRLDMGDLATPMALELARRLKRPPRDIAKQVAEHLDLPPLIASVTVEGAGYLNFRFDRGLFVSTRLRDVVSKPPADGRRITVEHTNINPNKAAHIGHLRNAVLGDTLVRCLRWLGHEVETQNYIDDTGVQVADVVVGFERLLGEGMDAVRKRIDDPQARFDYFCWDLYARTVRNYQENPEAKEWQRETLHRIERQEGETAKLAAMIAAAIVRWHLRTAKRIGIEYDLLVKESDIIRQHFWDRAFELLRQSGAVIHETEGKHAGCWVMKLADSPEFEGLEEPDKILVRSNGTVTYVGKDIAYQMWKFGLLETSFEYRPFLRYDDGRILWETTSDGDGDPEAPQLSGADQVVNVIDIRQAYLQKIVREGLRQLGHEEAAESSIHFSYEMVALSPATAAALGFELSAEDAAKPFVEMSGRKGLGVKADDLLDELETKALEALRERPEEREPIEETEQKELARQVAVAALRYFMLKYGRNKVIAFDFKEALAFFGDSGPYLQYSTLRAENIFRKMALREVDARLDASSIDELAAIEGIPDDMWDIVRSCADTADVVRRSVDALELATLTHHAFEIAQKFNSFYHKYPILNEANPQERQKRAACAEIFRQTMREILELLGIPVPDRM
ncbi:MAG TPA: arginine--tRNA ligase [Thermoanaerobaculia bacterium]